MEVTKWLKPRCSRIWTIVPAFVALFCRNAKPPSDLLRHYRLSSDAPCATDVIDGDCEQ